MTTCGVCLTPRRLVAITISADASLPPAAPQRLRRHGGGGVELLDHLAGLHQPALVLEQTTLACSTIAQEARARGFPIWVVPHSLLQAVQAAAGLSPISPLRAAAILARLPHNPWLRQHLTRLEPIQPDRQLPLL